MYVNSSGVLENFEYTGTDHGRLMTTVLTRTETRTGLSYKLS